MMFFLTVLNTFWESNMKVMKIMKDKMMMMKMRMKMKKIQKIKSIKKQVPNLNQRKKLKVKQTQLKNLNASNNDSIMFMSIC